MKRNAVSSHHCYSASTVYTEELIREAFENAEDGVVVGGNRKRDLRFADDQAIMANTNNGFQS